MKMMDQYDDKGSRYCGMPADAPIAMAYVPWQCMQETYDPEKALKAGTIFPELDKPFVGHMGGRR